MAARAVRSRSIARGRSHLWPPEVHWRSPGTACSALVDGARECHVTLALAFSTHKRDAEGSLTLPNTLFCHTCRPARRAVCGLLAVAGQSSRLSTLTIVTGQASRPARQPRSKPRCNNSSYGRSAPLRGASNTWGFPEPFLAMCWTGELVLCKCEASHNRICDIPRQISIYSADPAAA